MTLANGILDVDALGDLYPRGLSGRRVMFIGDSITNGSNASNAVYAFPMQACLQAGTLLFPTAQMVVRGYPGERTDQIVAHLLADIEAHDPDVIVFSGGTNNASQGTPASTYIQNIQFVAKVCRDRSIPLVLVNVPPRLSTSDAAKHLATEALNSWLALVGPSLGAEIADVWSALSGSTDGFLQSGYVSGTDEVHPSDSGHSRMATVVAAALRRTITRQPKSIITRGFGANLVTNPLMTGSIGANPTGWFNAGGATGDAATVGIVAASAGLEYGQLLEVDLNASTQNSSRTQGTTLNAAKYAANDWLLAEWYQEQENVSGISDPGVLPFAGNGVRARIVNGSSGTNIFAQTRFAAANGYHAAVFQVPPANPVLGFYLDVVANNGRRIRGRVGQVGVINLTQLGLATAITA